MTYQRPRIGTAAKRTWRSALRFYLSSDAWVAHIIVLITLSVGGWMLFLADLSGVISINGVLRFGFFYVITYGYVTLLWLGASLSIVALAIEWHGIRAVKQVEEETLSALERTHPYLPGRRMAFFILLLVVSLPVILLTAIRQSGAALALEEEPYVYEEARAWQIANDDTLPTYGLLASTNLLAAESEVTIQNFSYTASAIPAGATMRIAFSRDGSRWYNAAGTALAWNTMSVGTQVIDLAGLAWTSTGFYYKVEFTSDGSATAALDDVSLAFTPMVPITHTEYETSGTLTSTNLLTGQDIDALAGFAYEVSSLPAGTGLRARFSQDGSVWVDAAGTPNAWETLSAGENVLDLSGLGWTDPIFYYQMEFTSDATGTPVVEWVSVTWFFTSAPIVLTPMTGTRTNDNTPTITGTGSTAGDVIRIYSGALLLSPTATVGAAPGNAWSITLDALADGAYVLTATEDGGAQSQPSDSIALIVDTQTPMLAEVTPVPTLTKDSTPQYSFSASEAGTIAYGGSCTSATTNATMGNNTITLNTLADGPYSNCTITVTDQAGNVSNALSINSFTIDTLAPTLAEVTPVPTPTSDTTPQYTFSTSEAGTISYAGSCTSVTTSATSGNTTITLSDMADGTYSNCTLTVTDAAENSSTPLNISSFTILTIAPPAPTILSPLTGSVTGSLTPLITGTGSEASNVIKVYSGSTVLCSSTTAGFSPFGWSCTTDALNEQVYTLTATETDAASNESVASASISVRVDTTAPIPVSFSPADNTTSVPVTTDLTLTFDEVIGTTGTGYVTLRKASDHSVIEQINTATGAVTGSGTMTLVVSLTTALAQGTAYYVQIDATAFPDQSGNFFAGIDDTDTWSFTTVAAPVSVSSTAPQTGGGLRPESLQLRFKKAKDAIRDRFGNVKRESNRLLVQEENRRSEQLQEMAAVQREQRIAARIAEQEALLAAAEQEREELMQLFAERREERLKEAWAQKERELLARQEAVRAEQQALALEQERNRIAREERLAQAEKQTITRSEPLGPVTQAVAERRNRLFALVDAVPVLFKDVPLDAWYSPYVSFVIEENIAQGYRDKDGKPTGEFGVENAVTYAEILKMAVEASGRKTAPVSPRNASARGTWAAPFVALAETLGIPVLSPALDVNDAASRAEVIAMLLPIFDLPVAPGQRSSFRDVPVTHRHTAAIATAAFFGIAEGNPDGTFGPDVPVNRAEAAKLVSLLAELRKQ